MVISEVHFSCSGMRTHIRMHFDKKTNDFNEENYITCILEEDGIEIPPAAAVASAAAAAAAVAATTAQLMNQAVAAAQAASHQQLPPIRHVENNSGGLSGHVHYCELCPYYSAYKLNVVSNTHNRMLMSLRLNYYPFSRQNISNLFTGENGRLAIRHWSAKEVNL